MEEATSLVAQQRKNYTEVKSMNHAMEEKLQCYKSKALYQTASFLFFHGIILLSVPRIRCRFWWIPFTLSLIPSILFGLTFTSTILSYVRAQIQHDFNRMELEAIRYQISVSEMDARSSNSLMVNRDKFMIFKLYAYMYFTLFCLLGFTVVVLLACRSIPCDARNMA